MLCIKLINYWDKYTEMHGQQNVKKSNVCLLQPKSYLKYLCLVQLITTVVCLLYKHLKEAFKTIELSSFASIRYL